WDVIRREPAPAQVPQQTAADDPWAVVQSAPAASSRPPERSFSEAMSDSGTRFRQGLNSVAGGLMRFPVDVLNSAIRIGRPGPSGFGPAQIAANLADEGLRVADRYSGA